MKGDGPDNDYENTVFAAQGRDQLVGTVRGRIGYAFLPSAMFYATGGFAYGQVANSFSNDFVIGEDRRVSWKVEYLCVDLGTAHDSLVDPSASAALIASSKFADHIVRVGLNWHLN